MSEIPDTVDQFIAACDDAGFMVPICCEHCGVTINLILPYVPDPLPVVICQKHLEGES